MAKGYQKNLGSSLKSFYGGLNVDLECHLQG